MHNPIIGDDGELLRADTSQRYVKHVPLHRVNDPLIADQPAQPRRPVSSAINETSSKSPLFALLILVAVFLLLFFVGFFDPTRSIILNDYLLTADADGWQRSVGSNSAIQAVAWSPDSTQLAVANFNDAFHVWDVTTGQGIGSNDYRNTPLVAWSPNGAEIAYANRDIRLLNAESVLPIISAEGSSPYERQETLVRQFAWSPDGTSIAATHADLPEVRVWNVVTGHTKILLLAGVPFAVAWSPDGTRLLTSDVSGLMLWDTDTFESEPVDVAGIGTIQHIFWLDSGLHLLHVERVGSQTVIDVYHVETGTLHKFTTAFNCCVEVELSPDANQLAVFSRTNDNVELWDMHTDSKLYTFESRGHQNVNCVRWSPDSQYLAICGGYHVYIKSFT